MPKITLPVINEAKGQSQSTRDLSELKIIRRRKNLQVEGVSQFKNGNKSQKTFLQISPERERSMQRLFLNTVSSRSKL